MKKVTMILMTVVMLLMGCSPDNEDLQFPEQKAVDRVDVFFQVKPSGNPFYIRFFFKNDGHTVGVYTEEYTYVTETLGWMEVKVPEHTEDVIIEGFNPESTPYAIEYKFKSWTVYKDGTRELLKEGEGEYRDNISIREVIKVKD